MESNHSGDRHEEESQSGDGAGEGGRNRNQCRLTAGRVQSGEEHRAAEKHNGQRSAGGIQEGGAEHEESEA